MKFQFLFSSFVDDILVVCICVQRICLVFALYELKCFFSNHCPQGIQVSPLERNNNL